MGMNLQHDVVDGCLYLDGECVPGLVLVEDKLVVDREEGESREGLPTVLGRRDGLLVALSCTDCLVLQRLHLTSVKSV